MNPIDAITDIVKQDVLNKLNKQPSGKVLKHDLGLDNISHVYIQKIIGLSLNIYVVSYNSRYPTLFIPRSKLKTIGTMTIQKVRSVPNLFMFSNFKLSIPIELDEFIARIPSNSIIITQDICGDRFQNKSILESTKKGYYLYNEMSLDKLRQEVKKLYDDNIKHYKTLTNISKFISHKLNININTVLQILQQSEDE
jgi:hypothetical protein